MNKNYTLLMNQQDQTISVNMREPGTEENFNQVNFSAENDFPLVAYNFRFNHS